MADEDVATRAPENDQQQQQSGVTGHTQDHQDEPSSASTLSGIPGDTKAQTGPTMGEHCTTDRPLPSDPSGTTPQPSGEMTTLNGISTYISKPESYPHNPGKLLLFLTGGTGVHSLNNQLQADAYASRGFLVVMPDQFGGDPVPQTMHVEPSAADKAYHAGEDESGNVEPSNPTIIERIKMGVADTAKSFVIDMWLARQTAEKVLPIVRKALDGAKETFADAVANGAGVYGVGYCFGAKYILILCGQTDETQSQGKDEEKGEILSKGPELKAAAIAHGTLVTKEDIEGVKSPVAMACVAEDNLFPDEVREQGRAALELNAVEHDIKVFEGVPHGFAVVGDYKDTSIQARQADAFEMMSGWIEKH